MIDSPASTLVARDAELRVATDALATDRPGVLVTGEAGAGKTALVLAALAGHTVLSGQCFRSLAWTPGVPLVQAIGRPIPAGDVTWAAQAVATACRNAVLRLDDLQWADALTLEVLGLLPPTVRLAVTVRSGDPGAAPAEEVLSRRGLTTIALDPLGIDDATTLAMRRVPRLRPAEARRLAERCGGNPLLIEELGADPEPSSGLRRSVMGRLRRLGDAAWSGFAMLAVADEPLPSGWLPDVAALTVAGLVVDSGDGRVQPRHPLLAETVMTDLAEGSAERRRSIEAALAERAELEGYLPLAARCWASAGERERATALALRAVSATDRPGERAALLYLAAASASAQQAATLTVDAVDQLVRAGAYDQAARLIDDAPELDDAHWWGLVGRVRWQQGDDDAALDAFERGVSIVGDDAGESVLLRAEQARALLLARGEVERSTALAEAAYATAQELGLDRARALAVLATTQHFVGAPTAAADLRLAADLAANEGDHMVEFTSANNLVAVLEGMGRAREAIDLAAQYAARAEQLHMRGWQQQMNAMGHNASFHLGDYEAILADVPQILAGALDPRTRDQLELTLGMTLVDTGRTDEALERLTAALRTAAPDYNGRGSLLWASSEARLWAGEPAGALEDARAALELTPPGDRQLFPLLTVAHASRQLGRPFEDSWAEPDLEVAAGAAPELDGVRRLIDGDRETAARAFTDAAALWAGQHKRGEMRCRWLAADCSDDQTRAREQLLALEHELSELGWQPLLAQVRRSLRARGVRSAAPRGRVGELTAREREVLDLVAQGLSTDAVAKRLGLSPATVAAQISSARARLGAATRWQASSAG